MKKTYIILLCLTFALVLFVGIWSLVDVDATFSEMENKKLAEKPEFTFAALLDGSYIPAIESYYTETFPGRETLLKANRAVNNFYYYSGAEEESVLIITGPSGAELGGEALNAPAERPVEPEKKPVMKPEETPALPEAPETPVEPESPDPDEEKTPIHPVEPEEPQTPVEEGPPELGVPEEGDVEWAGNVVVIGDRAMEIPSGNQDYIARYAQAVNNLNAALGEGVRTISIVTPNGGEFYSPESMHTGIHSQKDMIDFCYSKLDEGIVPVDAYSGLRDHADEYIYFRTDHHWTQLGAYYAYEKFCEALDFEAVPLEQFETGVYENFVGSMYTFTAGYPQSEMLRQNPDTLTYYLPVYETHAKCYWNSALENGTPVSVVYTQVEESKSNKYLCFIGGDTPICIIESAAEGGTCMVLKESYGNAFVPFLTSHYSKIIVVDPREFNRDGKPSLDLTTFAAEQGVEDLIVINYPYMINNTAYIAWLNRLVGMDN